ncbi:MAG: hypothetical protein AB7O24_01080 [Kofleriaceae bacterium]
MRRFTQLASVAIFAVVPAITIGCGSGGTEGDDDDSGVDGGSDDEPIVNGLPASQFYRQFAWQTTMTGVEGAASFPINGAGHNAFLATLFLMPGGDATVFYGEGEGDVSTTGHSLNLDASTFKRRSTTWKVQGSELVLGNLMHCTGMSLNDEPVLRCTLDAVIVSSQAQGRAGLFENRLGASSPDDSEWTDYQP